MTTPHTIETRYRGILFRSRTEARWAVFLDELRLAWEYEREGFDLGDGVRYLPDFWLPQVAMWAEVKPEAPNDAELDKIKRLVRHTGKPCLLLIGSPEPRPYMALSWADDAKAYEWESYAISSYRRYPQIEGRFFGCLSEADRAEFRVGGMFDDALEAATAAAGARFEYGQEGRC